MVGMFMDTALKEIEYALIRANYSDEISISMYYYTHFHRCNHMYANGTQRAK